MRVYLYYLETQKDESYSSSQVDVEKDDLWEVLIVI